MKNNLENIITNWFHEGGHKGLILPDGWLGRPQAERRELTLCLSRPNRLIIEIDNKMYLILSDAHVIAIDSDELKIGFTRLIFDWRCSGSSAKDDFKVYEEGNITFAGVW
jgi:hypothetical protein